MIDRSFHLAIETSSRVSSITLGDDTREYGTTVLPPQERHTVDLLPAIDALCQAHSIARESLGTLFVSIGPGSFTGLRVGIAAAKLLAEILNLKIIPIPSIDVLAQNVPGPGPIGGPTAGGDHDPTDPILAVCLNLKKETVYSRAYHWRDHHWTPIGPAELRTMSDFLASLSRPTLVLGDPLPDYSHEPNASKPAWLTHGVTVLPPQLAVPRSQAVRNLGLSAAPTDAISPDALLPLYVRPPEAMELWEKRHATPPPSAA